MGVHADGDETALPWPSFREVTDVVKITFDNDDDGRCGVALTPMATLSMPLPSQQCPFSRRP
jgi:hypothetical protein